MRVGLGSDFMAFDTAKVYFYRASLAVIFGLLASCTISPVEQMEEAPIVEQIADTEATDYKHKSLTGSLTVLSLNVAHGRKEAMNQLLIGEQTIRHNLSEIATVLMQSGADVVAL